MMVSLNNEHQIILKGTNLVAGEKFTLFSENKGVCVRLLSRSDGLQIIRARNGFVNTTTICGGVWLYPVHEIIYLMAFIRNMQKLPQINLSKSNAN